MLTEERAEEIAREWLDAWNAHDLERILAHYHPEVEFTSPFVAQLAGREDGTLRGISQLRDYFGRALAAYPDLRFTEARVLTGVRSLVLHYRSVNGFRAAETMELGEKGLVVRVLAHYAPPE
jgi:ketosteroid isomerase-like protein